MTTERTMMRTDPASHSQRSRRPQGTASAGSRSATRARRIQRQGAGYAEQAAALSPSRVAQDGLRGANDRLPFADRIQASFGRHDVSSVPAAVGGAAAVASDRLGARAYASDGQVAFKTAPDLHLAAHEAAHVVQQRAGVSLRDGLGRAGDAYERHADAVADAVVAGRSAETLLDGFAGAGGGRTGVQREEAPEATSCPDTEATPDPGEDAAFSVAGSFADLIALVSVAEQRLRASGMAASTQDVVHLLRGIFYGTEWSMDYVGAGNEQSEMRNRGFDYYTKTPRPGDPRPALGQSLFEALRGSPEVTDPGGHHTDFGHIIIGLDSRNWAARKLPTGTGGTGLDVVTWLGDIGGGAGMLAMRRGGAMGKASPTKRAIDMFPASQDYGASVNIEGDMAGTVGVQIRDGQTLTSALEEYLTGCGEGGARYDQRVELFLTYLGGEVSGGALVNQAALVDQLAAQIWTFGTVYALSRLKDKGLGTASTIRESGKHIEGASHEMAAIYVAALVAGLADPSRNVTADASMDPGPTPAAAAAADAFESVAQALELGKEAERKAGQIGL